MGTCLELAHDGHDRLAGAQQHLPVGGFFHHRDLLIDNAEEVHRSRRPQLPILLLLRLPAQVRLATTKAPSVLLLITRKCHCLDK